MAPARAVSIALSRPYPPGLDRGELPDGGLLRVSSWSAWQPWAPFTTEDIADGTVATVLGLMGLLLWLAAIGHLLVMLTRRIGTIRRPAAANVWPRLCSGPLTHSFGFLSPLTAQVTRLRDSAEVTQSYTSRASAKVAVVALFVSTRIHRVGSGWGRVVARGCPAV
jgi:hypothetical protein